MKRKIGELRNKPIVEGDKNLLSKNEIHKENIANFLGVDSGDLIFVGFKEPVIVEETNSVDTPVMYALTSWANGLKFSNNKYYYGWNDFGENLWDKELCLAAAMLKIPKMPHNPTIKMLYYETYNELVDSLSANTGVPIDEIKDLIFPISRDEFFQKVK